MISRNEVNIALVAALTTVSLGYIMFYAPLKTQRTYVEQRTTECIERLAAYQNSLPTREYGEVNFLYNRHTDQCLYRSNFVADKDGGYYFEKFIADVFTGETLGEYAEIDGRRVKGELAAYTATYEALFLGR